MILQPSKICIKCNIPKPLSDFGKNKARKDGKKSTCRLCDTEYRNSRSERISKYKQKYRDTHRDQINQKEKIRRSRPETKKRALELGKIRKQADPLGTLYANTLNRAKRTGIPFSILKEDLLIPERCPIFGTSIEVKESSRVENRISIDKLIPELGYVKGNVYIISDRANTVKSNGSSDEHRKIACWIEELIKRPPQRAEVSIFEAQTEEFQKRSRLLVNTARTRCKKSGVLFSLDSREVVIPKVCPILGIPIIFGPGKVHDNSPSLDKIIPERGYISSNVAVISWRANRIKNVGTAEEHRLIADWIDAQVLKAAT